MRLIDADALIGALHDATFEDGTDREIVYRCIETAPTIENVKDTMNLTHYYERREAKMQGCKVEEEEWI